MVASLRLIEQLSCHKEECIAAPGFFYSVPSLPVQPTLAPAYYSLISSQKYGCQKRSNEMDYDR